MKPLLKPAKVDLTFRGSVSDIDKTFSEGKKEEKESKPPAIFDQRTQEQIVDAMEEEMGLRRKRFKASNITHKNRIFRPALEADRDLLNKLMNEPTKYNVLKWSENWDRTGELKIFVVYQEILEDK